MTIDYLPGVGNRPPVRAGNTPPLPVQAFTFDLAHVPAGSNAAPDTLLWQPVVAAKGRTQVSFDLPRAPGVYRVHVEAHGVSGRLGVAELNIDTTSRGK